MRARSLGVFVCVTILIVAAFTARSSAGTGAEMLLNRLIAEADTTQQFNRTLDLLALALASPSLPDPLETEAVSARLAADPRTDRQTGGSAGAGGLSIVDKPGIADLINVAIENGAITQFGTGTTFTLQTTPYLVYSRFGGADDAQAWDRLTALRKLALSGSFTATGPDSGRGLENLESADAKYVLFGDRSARDRAFRDHIRLIVGNRINEPLVEATGSYVKWQNSLAPEHSAAIRQAIIDFSDWREGSGAAVTSSQVRAKLNDVLAPVRARLSPQELEALTPVVQAIVAEELSRSEVGAVIEREAQTWCQRGPELSLDYGFTRDSTTSDYSRGKVLFAYDSGEQLTINLNAELAVNHQGHTPAGVHLKRVRSYTVEAAITLGPFAHNDMDASMGLRVVHPEGASRPQTSAQLQTRIHLSSVLTVPVAVTYMSRSPTTSHEVTRVEVGLSLSGDAVLGLGRK